MKHTFFSLAALLLLTQIAAAEPTLAEVSYTLGPQQFREGDLIEIKSVEASSPKFEVGDTVVVRGTYILKSRVEAKLGLFVTQSKGDGRSKVSPTQRFAVQKGSGDFEMSLVVQHEGYLHVTFYPTESGSGFGGVYFGSPRQMLAIKHWSLDWYLGRPVPATRLDEAP